VFEAQRTRALVAEQSSVFAHANLHLYHAGERISTVASLNNEPARRFGLTLTAESIFGRSLALPECVSVLQQFRQSEVIHRIGLLIHINARVFMDPDTPEADRNDHLRAFVTFMFDVGQMKSVAVEAARAPRDFRPLSDQALLATLELALTVCPPDSGRSFDRGADRVLLTHVILSFQTVLFSRALVDRIKSVGSLAGLGEHEFGEFVRNRVAHSTRAYYRHAMGRLFGFCCTPEIGEVIQQKMGTSVEQWFQEYLGVSPRAYVVLAFMLVTPALRLNLAQPKSQELFFDPERFFAPVREPQRSQLISLLEISTCALAEFKTDESLQLPLSDYLYRATRFFVRPILDIGPASICVSPTLLLNKFLTGLPYLALEARKRMVGRPLSDSEAKAARAPFGHLFERYVIWLLRQWLDTWRRTEVISPYFCRGSGNKSAERDLVIVRGDAAFAFEIKATVASLELRRTGCLQYIDRMVKDGAMQVKHAAEALLAREAVRTDGTPILGIRRVIPCVLTYDSVPLSPPVFDVYESHLEREAKMPLFREDNGVYPLQFLDADFLESWETNFDLSPESGSPFGYLETRARDPLLRHREIDSSRVVGHARPESPRPFENLVERAAGLLGTEGRSWLNLASSRC
jgi:hypothetical protein